MLWAAIFAAFFEWSTFFSGAALIKQNFGLGQLHTEMG